MIFEKKTLNGFKKNVNGSVRKISKSNLEGNLTFHPSIVERGTLHIFLKVIFQYQNGEPITNLKSYHYLYLINHKCDSFSLVFVFVSSLSPPHQLEETKYLIPLNIQDLCGPNQI